MGVSLLTGIALSYAWGRMNSPVLIAEPAVMKAGNDTPGPPVRTKSSPPAARTPELPEQFSPKSIQKSLDRYDALTEPDLLAEARLQCLMFALPKKSRQISATGLCVVQPLDGARSPGGAERRGRCGRFRVTGPERHHHNLAKHGSGGRA
jgi:hypothetical protein